MFAPFSKGGSVITMRESAPAGGFSVIASAKQRQEQSGLHQRDASMPFDRLRANGAFLSAAETSNSSVCAASRAFLPGKARQRLSFIFVSLFFIASSAANAQRAEAPLPELPSASATKKLALAKNSMVSTAHPLATEAGLKMLDKGGSATDAAIAVQMVLGLIESQSSGIGGGAFILHFDAAKKSLVAYDGRETAPMGVTPSLFLDKDGKPMRLMDAVVGGRSVGVPGVLRAFEMTHARHGKLKWAELFEPAIELAEKGFPMAPRMYTHLQNDSVLRNLPATREYMFQADGTPKALGSTMRNPQYAATLKRIAREGADAFYRGEIAKDMVAAVRGHANAGYLSEDDLKDYQPRSEAPVCGPYRTYRICSMPPPSSGGIAILQMMQMLERFDMAALRPDSSAAVHLFSEAGRLAFADRERYVADDKFVTVPTAGLIDPAYNKQRSELIKVEKSMGKAEPGNPKTALATAMADGDAWDRPGTTHFSIVDRWGNAISVTSSVEATFGSKIFVHGFFLNNQLTDFSMTPTRDGFPVANAVFPGKRPRSSMAPTMVFDAKGELHSVIGSALGSVIINFVAKTLVATLDWKMDMQAAIASPHFGSRGGPVELERGTPIENLQGALRSMGHEVRVGDLPSGLHGIMRTSQGWQGGADPRRDGFAQGR
jgi:gamma-glutamyltranspeptidase/glutathione hydrolase